MSECFKGSTARAATVLARLYICGYENICLYKQLVTLREDLSIENIVYHTGSHVEKVNRYLTNQDNSSSSSSSSSTNTGSTDLEREQLIADTADLPMTTVVNREQVQHIVSAMHDILLQDAPSISESSSTSTASTIGECVCKYAFYIPFMCSNPIFCVCTIGVNGEGAEKLTTSHFRYTGERGVHTHTLTGTTTSTNTGKVRTAVEVERLLSEISTGLLPPLQLLREQYHKLHRD